LQTIFFSLSHATEIDIGQHEREITKEWGIAKHCYYFLVSHGRLEHEKPGKGSGQKTYMYILNKQCVMYELLINHINR